MKSLGELARAAGDLLVAFTGPEDLLVRDVCYDDAPVRPGDLFFCVDGGTVDGHRFARAAVEAGAVALCVERPTGAGVPEVVVSDSRRAMARMSAAFFGRPADDLMLLAVTGTNGKTTTTFLVDAILTAAGRRTGVVGTLGAWICGERRDGVRASPATPPTLHRLLAEMRTRAVEAVAVEATSHALALHRLEGLRFASAGFTNLSRDHLDFHGTLEAYFEAKQSLFAPEHVARATVNVDDPWGRRLLVSASVPCIGFGCAPDAAVRAVDIRLGEAGTRFRLVVADEGEAAVSTALAGAFNVSNCLAAAAVALQAGASLDAVGAGLAAAPALPGRLEPVDAGQPFAVLVDYAHGPGALEAALVEARRRADSRRVVCVFGCGGGADPGKRPLMGALAAHLADRVIVTTDNPRGEDPDAIAAEIRAGARGAVETVLDRAEAIARAVESARPGDVVLVAGKGHERTQQVAGATFPFDDREVARRALAAGGR